MWQPAFTERRLAVLLWVLQKFSPGRQMAGTRASWEIITFGPSAGCFDYCSAVLNPKIT